MAARKETLCSFAIDGKCNKTEETCKFLHPNEFAIGVMTNVKIDGKKICKFALCGTCKNGDKCRFAHFEAKVFVELCRQLEEQDHDYDAELDQFEEGIEGKEDYDDIAEQDDYDAELDQFEAQKAEAKEDA
jgi:hypothetical protein